MPSALGPFQLMLDRALGAVAQRLGTPYSVYRNTPASSGDFPDGWTLISNGFPAITNRVRSGDAEVAMTSERTVWFELMCDVSAFWLGDVFVGTDAPYFPGVSYGERAVSVPDTTDITTGFALAWHQPLRPPLGARLDRRVGVYRPALVPLTYADGAPLSPSQQWRSTHEFDTPLQLKNGVFSWGPPGGVASWVPCGFGTSDRQTRGEDMNPDPPGMVPSPRYYAYLPPLPGYQAAEGDAIITEDDARYVCISPFRQESGVVGSQLMIQRYISQSN
jgi:hypothetical protein